MIEHILNSVLKAEKLESKLSSDVFHLDGMSGVKGRCLLNNLANYPTCNYFEIGTFKGSTIISASYQNEGKFTALDNFSQFGGPKQELLNNKEAYKDECNFTFIESDCWKVDKSLIPDDINLYFFDGGHDYHSQKMALDFFVDKMAKQFILIVDDWNDKSFNVQSGTLDGIKNNNLTTLFSLEIGHNVDSDRPGYWNGFGIFLLEKK